VERIPNLIIPIEVKVRELFSKFYLGCVAAERGFRVIIGGYEDLRNRACWMPRGSFYLDKSSAPTRRVWFDVYRKLGIRVVGWCEEGLVFSDEQEYVRRKIAPEALGMMECFFVWGPRQAAVIVNHAPWAKNLLVPAGNPRIDLLTPGLRQLFAEETKKIQKQYPRMILINTNFGHCNHAKGEDAFLKLQKEKGAIATLTDEQFIVGLIQHKRLLFDAFVEMIPALSQKFSDHTIIVRPHPSEDYDTWHSIIAGWPNVRMVQEGAVIPWLLACSLLIHNGCTTGLEAVLLGKSVIAYQPVIANDYDFHLPNGVSNCVYDLNSALALAEQLLEEKQNTLSDKQYDMLDSHLYNIQGGASDLIAEYLWSLHLKQSPSTIWKEIVCRLRRGYWQFRIRRRLNVKTEWYVTKKFPGLSRDEVDELLILFQKTTGRFENVRIGKYLDRYNTLEPAS
jgi:surface carbohydrate biosynthesis protein